ncbi:ribosome biogenesis protein NOP53-like isoform X2 [Amaranthus tricolor]|uniref:ribosome biogenesis protein NOP53-like isoform X2 n=1 Tax=Amaranthus tricolor TaxID=29722 RepID=UPI00258743E2|nr:ribosome biogenesis protein NOP53-like isoform X2 [Amaranthus tricolor]
MGKKRAKKVKKAWRNISTKDIEDFNEKSTHDANSGGSLTVIPSDSLFVVDKSTDVLVKRKIEKKREKALRFESILSKNPFVKTVPSSILKKCKKKDKLVAQPQDASNQEGKGEESGHGLFDIWNNQSVKNIKGKKKVKPSLIPAVEVEPPGCSFNPEDLNHKDSLAQAVAEEMKKVYKKELDPEPIPLTVPGEPVTEEERYFLEVDNGDDEDDEMDEGIPTEEGNAKDENMKSKPKQITRVEQNKRIRRKERQKTEAEAKKITELSKAIDSIPDILQEIAEEDEEKQKRHIRRTIAKEERLKAGPPRLGKRKFEPAPTQVLLTEEITGSLRKLKACCTLARDRFKSLEKRGIIIPSAKSSRK